MEGIRPLREQPRAVARPFEVGSLEEAVGLQPPGGAHRFACAVIEGDGFKPLNRLGLNFHRKSVSKKPNAPVFVQSPAAHVARFAIGRYGQAEVVLGAVDGVSHVGGLAPGPVGGTSGNKKIQAPHSQVAVGRKVEGVAVGMETGANVVVGGVHLAGKGLGAGPGAVVPEGAVEEGGLVFVALGSPNKEQKAAVGRQGGLGLPLGSVQAIPKGKGLGPALGRPNGAIEVARTLSFRPVAAGEDQVTAVAPNGHRSFVERSIDFAGEKLGHGPPPSFFHAAVEEVFVVGSAGVVLAGKEQKRVSCHRNGEVVQFHAVDGIA